VTPRPLFTPGKNLVPMAQEAGWAPGSVWIGVENLAPHRDSIPGPPARSESLYRLSYPAHTSTSIVKKHHRILYSLQRPGVLTLKILRKL